MTQAGAARRRGTPALLLDPSTGEPRPSPSRQKRVDRYELLSGGTKPSAKAPEIHRLVEEYDTRGLRNHLKTHPDDVNARNTAGDAPLHAIAAKGAVLVAEVLDEFGPDHLASNRRGLLPGHLAAEKHPKTAQFLFERALATEAREPSWRSIEELEKRLESLREKPPEAIDRAAAELCGIPIAELDAPGEVVKNRTHLEAIKGTVLDLKSEGWWQDKFVPQRVRALLRAAVEAPEEMQPLLIREISVQLDLLRTIRRVMATKKCAHESIREMSMTLEARQILDRVQRSAPGEETALALGWTGHAIYCGMRRVQANRDANHPEDTLLIRIDNLGAGITKSHEKDGELVQSRAVHVPLSFLEQQEGPLALEAFLRDVLIIKATAESDEDDFYSRVARFKSEVKAATGCGDLVESDYSAHEKSLPKQIAGNCVVANTFPGLAARLGDDAFEWFRDFERQLARELVETHADTNKLIDEACKERDQREIGKLLEESGPWAEKLQAIIDGAKELYDAGSLAKGITVEQMKAVIEGGDTDALRILLAHGARVDLQDDKDGTPLHWAATAGSREMVQALLDRGAAVNAMDNQGDTPLHVAVRAGSHPVVALLLERGAAVDRENKAGVTPRAALDDKLDQTLLIARALRPSDATPARRSRLRSSPP